MSVCHADGYSDSPVVAAGQLVWNFVEIVLLYCCLWYT